MKEEYEAKLQEEFPFMKQFGGCECASGWYGLLQECCRKITEQYKSVGIPVDFVPEQIKEKFGTLRFYYGFEDMSRVDKATEKLRAAIADIVSDTEDKSAHVCEVCGDTQTARLRTEMRWKRTYCDRCYSNYKAVMESKENEASSRADRMMGEYSDEK